LLAGNSPDLQYSDVEELARAEMTMCVDKLLSDQKQIKKV